MKARTHASKPAADATPQPLAKFLHNCSPDADTRTMAAAMFAITHWQVAGIATGSRLPWLLMVNAAGATVDPLDAAAGYFAVGMDSMEPKEQGSGPMLGATPQQALNRMLTAVAQCRELKFNSADDEQFYRQHQEIFSAAKSYLFGSGRAGHYARMRHDQLGWMSDHSDDIILRLDRPEDHAAFRSDVMEHPERLLKTNGYGSSLMWCQKVLMLSGSLDPTQWDGEFVRQLLNAGHPVVFLPHLAETAIDVGSKCGELAMGRIRLAQQRLPPFPFAHRLSDASWCRHYEQLMRSRLRELPGDYEFAILQAVRDLEMACSVLAIRFDRQDVSSKEWLDTFRELYAKTLRAITIGLASLAWHGLGIDAGCGKDLTFKLVQHLQIKRTVSRRDLLVRFQSLTSVTRDAVLERLAAEGVVELEQKTVSIVPLKDFVRGLFLRPELKEPDHRQR
jgi:hypothetical protein